MQEDWDNAQTAFTEMGNYKNSKFYGKYSEAMTKLIAKDYDAAKEFVFGEDIDEYAGLIKRIDKFQKFRLGRDEFIEDIIKAGLLLGRLVFKQNVTEECKVEVVNKDGILVTDEELKERYVNEIAQGLRQPWEYRVKFFGEDEETARRMIEDTFVSDTEE